MSDVRHMLEYRGLDYDRDRLVLVAAFWADTIRKPELLVGQALRAAAARHYSLRDIKNMLRQIGDAEKMDVEGLYEIQAEDLHEARRRIVLETRVLRTEPGRPSEARSLRLFAPAAAAA